MLFLIVIRFCCQLSLPQCVALDTINGVFAGPVLIIQESQQCFFSVLFRWVFFFSAWKYTLEQDVNTEKVKEIHYISTCKKSHNL